MTNAERLEDLAQKVHLTMFGRFIDDVEDEEGREVVEKTTMWAGLFFDEYEREADWQRLRENDKELGAIVSSDQTFILPGTVRKLIIDDTRPLVVMQGSSIVSFWDVVDPNQITKRETGLRDRRVTVVGNKIIFSQPLDETELGGVVVADVMNHIPALSEENVEALDLVKPEQLLVLGIAKNATLPDIVQGGISPSLTQKYADLLEQAVLENNQSSVSDTAVRDDYSYIGGVY